VVRWKRVEDRMGCETKSSSCRPELDTVLFGYAVIQSSGVMWELGPQLDTEQRSATRVIIAMTDGKLSRDAEPNAYSYSNERLD